ncbi:MAG: OsmC family protein [Spirochaetota bacterium]
MSVVIDKGEAAFRRELRFAEELPAEQRERLLAVANACPVHKVLTGKISVETM